MVGRSCEERRLAVTASVTPFLSFSTETKAVANGGPKRKANSVLVSVTLKNDANGSEKPNANALRLGDSVLISQ